MPSVSSKRARITAASVEVKKARVVDPIAEKIEMISKSISDPECQLQDSHREMLLLALPHALSLTSEERHEYQGQVAQMIGKVLNDYVAYWGQQVSDNKIQVSASVEKATETMAIVEESATTIRQQEEEVTECKVVVDKDLAEVNTAQEGLKSASTEVAEFDENLQVTITERNKCSAIFNDYFVPLKSGIDDSKEVARLWKEVQPMLKKLSIEPSLLIALAPAFKESAAKRGPFDIMAIEGAEKVFTEHVAKLQDQIDNADTTKAEKVSSETASQEVLKAAMDKHMASKSILKAAEEKLASLEAKHVDLLSACNVAAEASGAAERVLATKAQRLAQVQVAFTAFTELHDRHAGSLPAADETGMVQDELEAVSVA